MSEDQDGEKIVLVLPVTHSPPADPDLAVEIPIETKRRLGLDDQRSWIVVTDANRFVWPGPDLRPSVRGDASSVAYGLLPRGLFYEVREKFARAIERRLAGVVRRTEQRGEIADQLECVSGADLRRLLKCASAVSIFSPQCTAISACPSLDCGVGKARKISERGCGGTGRRTGFRFCRGNRIIQQYQMVLWNPIQTVSKSVSGSHTTPARTRGPT